MPIRWHLVDPDLLRQAIVSTATALDYNPRLVEKDYFASVVLEQLSTSGAGITFKGGTSLSKIHANFHRLSEDLDFTVSTLPGSTPASRRTAIAGAKRALKDLPDALDGFRLLDPLRGANNSSQYNGAVGYESLIDGHTEAIRIEISVSEPTLLPVETGSATTAVLHPITGEPLVPGFEVEALGYDETMAEKARAALCRREVAIRDYFDLDHAVRAGRLDPFDPAFLDLLRRKLQAPRTGDVDVSERRQEDLRRQLDTQLLPVLRDSDFRQFDLMRAVDTVRAVARELERA